MEEKKKRGRPKKADAPQKPILDESPEVLQMSQKKTYTMEDVQKSLTTLYSSMLGISDTSSMNYSGRIYNGFSPFLQNSRLKSISSLPVEVTPEKIAQALREPQNYEQVLRNSSWSLSASQYLYYKILREAADVPLFKHYVVPPLLSEAEYLKPAFKNEEVYVNSWVDKFDIVNTFKRIALEVKREGKSTYVLRQSVDEDAKTKQKTVRYVTLQKLPTEYTKLTAIGEHGYIASFNLLIFMRPAFSPLQYPEYIQNLWSELNKGQVFVKEKTGVSIDLNALRKFTYFDHNQVKTRGQIEVNGSNYMYWVQLPQELCFTFASDSSNAWVAPDTMGLFSALQELTDYSTLAGLVASTPLTAILTGQAETCATGPGQDQTVLSPHTMLAFQNAFNAMSSGNVQAFLAPFKDLKLQSLPNIPNASDIKTKAVQNFVSTAGEGGIIAATDKPSVAMTKGAQLMTGSQYDFVTRQFESVLNFILNHWLGLQYQWRLKLWGDIFTFESKVKMLKEMVMSGATFLLPKLASAFDLNMSQVKAICSYIKANKIYDCFSTLGQANKEQVTNSDKAGVGRPALDEGEIENDNTAISKDAGNNVSDIKDFAVQEGFCCFCGAEIEEGQVVCESCQEELLHI